MSTAWFARVITPATSTFTARDSHPIKIPVPVYNGIDVTYPLNNVISIDYFWNIPPEERKFICQVDANGYGLVQTSTKRLKGRKLFVWGNSEGGERWKNFLTADDERGSYNEIQAGIAQTQYECLPMPPKTVWEWVEAYGAIHTDPARTHGNWADAREEAAQRLNDMITEADLEQVLLSTKDMSKRPAEEMLFGADGWGALEQERRRISGEDVMCPYLDFGSLTSEQQPWLSLLEKGSVGEHAHLQPPVSYMCQEEWTALLARAVKAEDKSNWFAWLQLGLHTFGFVDGAIDICVPMTQEYEQNREDYEMYRKYGDELWYYDCCLPRGNGYINRFMDYALLASRYHGWGNYAYDLTGYLHWAANHYQPEQDPFVQSCPVHRNEDEISILPAGDSHIMYPGEDGPWMSVRMENHRAGFEEYEMLRAVAAKDKALADLICGKVFHRFDDVEYDPLVFRAARNELIRAMENCR